MFRLRLVLPALLLAAVARADQPPTIPAAEYKSLLKTIRPATGEDAYAEVPWQTSLWEARKKAAAEGKPYRPQVGLTSEQRRERNREWMRAYRARQRAAA